MNNVETIDFVELSPVSEFQKTLGVRTEWPRRSSHASMPSMGADPFRVEAFGALEMLDNDDRVAAADFEGNGRLHCWSSSIASLYRQMVP